MNEWQTSPSLRDDQTTLCYEPGTRVRVTQQIPQRDDNYTTQITGTVVRQERQATGSWFARNKDGKFWLDRLVVQKDDGEISILNLDEYSAVEVLTGSAGKLLTAPTLSAAQNRAGSLT